MACTEELSPSILIKVVEFFKNHCSNAELKHSMQPNQIA